LNCKNSEHYNGVNGKCVLKECSLRINNHSDSNHVDMEEMKEMERK
jgi:hypothetical protein